MSNPDQLVMVSAILGGNATEEGEAAYLDVRGPDNRVTRIALRHNHLQMMEFAFGDLRGLTAQERKKAGKDEGLVEVTALTVRDLRAKPDLANDQIALELVHENTRSTHVLLTVPQTEELQRRIDAAKSDLSAYRKPN
jgi:hypothetical protein